MAKKQTDNIINTKIDCRGLTTDALADMEWLINNSRGSYSSSSVLCSNTRRYHGLLVRAALPPVGRQVCISAMREEIIIDGEFFDISSFNFPGSVSPDGYKYLLEFTSGIAPTWKYDINGCVITKQIVLARNDDIVAIRYKVQGKQKVQMRLWPFAALRDFHAMRRKSDHHETTFEKKAGGVLITQPHDAVSPAWIGSAGASFTEQPQWWYNFQYKKDLQRGQDGLEDLMTPGFVSIDVQGKKWTSVYGSTAPTDGFDIDKQISEQEKRLQKYVDAVGADADAATKRLAAATDQFVVRRNTSAGPSRTILAGYHWFADWGRDTFIALPGLLLTTGRFKTARSVIDTFAHAVSKGMIPNRFDDYGSSPHYNSIDASLWFIIAVDRYINASGDESCWAEEFSAAAQAIVEHYHDGTRFGIHADADGLISGGDYDTQLTWMDVKYNGQAMTPRFGKAVEINALWIECLNILARRCQKYDPAAADKYAMMASNTSDAFTRMFWFDQGGYLYDCIGPEGPDASLRPNQLIAASMPSAPLSTEQRRSIIKVCQEHLLTPHGIRTLTPHDGRYRARYSGSWESRDRAYHQGTAWAWLMGPMVQTYLLSEEFSDSARKTASDWLKGFEKHLDSAAIGQVNEIFDGSAPYTPRGCVAQAWSVAELLRAKLMIKIGKII